MTSDERAPERVDVVEGGDPACWAHLFEDEDPHEQDPEGEPAPED